MYSSIVKENVMEFYRKPYFLHNIIITQACNNIKKTFVYSSTDLIIYDIRYLPYQIKTF